MHQRWQAFCHGRSSFGRCSQSCLLLLFVLICLPMRAGAAQTDPLPSWNEGPAKQAVLQFVRAVTDPSSPAYVQPQERAAVFDNDGTLWAEQPLYFQALFAMDGSKPLPPSTRNGKKTNLSRPHSRTTRRA
jgi:hypothetical protein